MYMEIGMGQRGTQNHSYMAERAAAPSFLVHTGSERRSPAAAAGPSAARRHRHWHPHHASTHSAMGLLALLLLALSYAEESGLD